MGIGWVSFCWHEPHKGMYAVGRYALPEPNTTQGSQHRGCLTMCFDAPYIRWHKAVPCSIYLHDECHFVDQPGRYTEQS